MKPLAGSLDMGLPGRGGTLGAAPASESGLGAELLRVGTDWHRKQRFRRAPRTHGRYRRRLYQCLHEDGVVVVLADLLRS